MEDKTMTNLARTFALTGLAFALGATGALAQQVAPAPAAQAPAQTVATQAATQHATPMKAGERNCIRDTGTHIRTKTDDCLPVVGRSYSGAELRSTGQLDPGRALQMLDPSIRIGQ
jgi:hypothetical protein